MGRLTDLLADRRRAVLAGVVALALVAMGVVVAAGGRDGDDGASPAPTATTEDASIVVGAVSLPEGSSAEEDPAEQGPGVAAAADGVTLRPQAESPSRPGLAPPDGAPPPPPIPFRSDTPDARGLVFVAVAGSDARPGEDVTRTRADSVHLLAIDPATGAGTIVGIPRDAWVDIPGHGRGKINSSLALGGPQLFARTVAEVTGAPVGYYVVTGFEGFAALVDDLGGVDVHLDRRMDDRFSGARFERGWHRFTGAEALAYSRNRKDTALGDFSRSENHGLVMLSTLAKMRAEIGDDGGLERWLGALRRHVSLDLPAGDLLRLAATARRTDPRRMANVVASGTVGRAEGRSVVFLDDGARATFADVADDAVLTDPPAPWGPPGYRFEGDRTTTTTAPGPTAPVPSTTTTTPVLGSSTTSTSQPGDPTATLLPGDG